ncbi:MAG: ribose-phosphate diphosphokinase [Methanotrichaceae archaeon]|nr:ribose-phosphate diphosphokinase [Methanotrichaceae archaeon]
MIISGPASQHLAVKVASILHDELALCEYRSFPDGEAYSQIISNLDNEVVIIQSTPTDKDIIYLLQLLDICKGLNISLVIPYFGYARQDKIFNNGEPMTARALASAMNPFLGDKSEVYLINIHSTSILSHFACRSRNLDATHLLAKEIENLGLRDPIVISPDKGAIAIAQTTATYLDTPFDYFQKTRLNGTEVYMIPKNVEVNAKDVVIIDDMITTGGTMATAAKLLHQQGANRIFVAAVHPVLTGNALIKLYRSGIKSILATDTLDKAISTISVASLIAEAIKFDSLRGMC